MGTHKERTGSIGSAVTFWEKTHNNRGNCRKSTNASMTHVRRHRQRCLRRSHKRLGKNTHNRGIDETQGMTQVPSAAPTLSEMAVPRLRKKTATLAKGLLICVGLFC